MKTDKPKTTDWIVQAKAIARQMVTGEKDAHYGCEQLEIICEENNWPDELQQLAHLSHLQTGHEQFGFKKDDLKADILEEARKLLDLKEPK